jgi:ubiquinone/menaquinone biosynthesis C-methylase UbiE
MNEQKDKPMPDIGFKIMSFLLALYHRFVDLEKDLEKTGIREGQIVLDFGCGPGHYSIAAANIVGEQGKVYALDIHPLAIKAVEHKAKKKKLTNITTILSDRDTGLPEESIDVVLLYDTIHMITDKRALLKELHRVMKPNGLLSIWVGHMKVKDVSEVVTKNGLFSLRDQRGRLLNFEKGAR